MDDFLRKLKKVVRIVVCIVLYGPAISQSECKKAGPYQLSYNNGCILGTGGNSLLSVNSDKNDSRTILAKP